MNRITLHIDVVVDDAQIDELQRHVGEQPITVVDIHGFNGVFVGRFEGANDSNVAEH
jgi:hypothetical protein